MTETLAQTPTRNGYAALLGRPNVGKSTLFNRLLGLRTVAVTHKPHTTRCNIRGIVKHENSRIVLIDTPGIHRDRKHRLSGILNRNITHALSRIHVCVLIVECERWESDDRRLLDLIRETAKPCILLLNKIDRVPDKTHLFQTLTRLSSLHDFAELIPVSALRDKSFDTLKKAMCRLLPQADKNNQTTDTRKHTAESKEKHERLLVEEIIRETIMLDLHKEVPYASHVRIVHWSSKDDVLHCRAHILVERESQKAIVLGRGGKNIKRLGSQARHTLEAMLKRSIYLEIRVVVHDAWRNDPEVVRAYIDNEPV